MSTIEIGIGKVLAIGKVLDSKGNLAS